MNNEEKSFEYLSIRELFSEVVIRDLILFVSLFLFTISQQWDNLFLLFFPLITFTFGIFFRLVDENKWRTRFQNSPVSYSPLGSEKKHANRFMFSALLLLILLFWFGAESLYHPQLIDNYSMIFIILFFFIYTFAYFWIFIDLWKYCRIKIKVEKETNTFSKKVEYYDNLIQFLNIRFFKRITYISLYSFLALNILNILLTLLIQFEGMPSINFYLPGTGIESSNPLLLHYLVYLLLLAPPIITILLLILMYRDINKMKPDKLFDLVDKLPKDLRLIVLEQLKMLNKKLLQDLKIE